MPYNYCHACRRIIHPYELADIKIYLPTWKFSTPRSSSQRKI